MNVDNRLIAVVTGATGGMGRETAALLAAKHGMKVFLMGRNREKGMEAVRYVNDRSGREDAQFIYCDLASLASIKTTAEVLAAACERIDVLVNNAGVVTIRREETEDGFERQLGVNHLGHFVLTGRLLPLLAKSEAGRIVVVSSGAHKIGQMDYDDPQLSKRFTVWGAYGRSKMANIWFTKELARRLARTSITVNALHPGAVSTDIGVNRNTGFGTLVHRVLRPFFLSPEQGSATAVYLATSSDIHRTSGGYYYKQKLAPVTTRAGDAEQASRFWSWSEKVTGFHWPEL
ncbi:SDR family oxidoreductase [Paenibacillus sp. 1011MAR3C5]|uniref:SDR family oxidoreductase n=1 Tax=Paenibacillus sp. 1011MAR3C5 TaxID=1675787 RepID=UPI000E6C544D|nr:SDR family oxidoreductase [Paenibacillus sp. 1011MAR3C5]RJE87033.1 SDR family oxidoreductase [Paenibacillus sp. 1011MAR3C5]